MSPGRTFLISASSLMSGTVFAQVITFGLSFLLTRLYSPVEFGHYSIFTGWAGILAAASTGAFDRVVLLARSDGESRRAASVVLLLSLSGAVIVLLIGIAIQLLGLAPYLPLSVLDLVFFIPMFMVSYAGAQVLNYSGLRRNRAGVVAGFKVAQSLTMGAVQVLASPFKAVPGLVVGSVAGWLVLFAAALQWNSCYGRIRRELRWRGLIAVVRRYWRYPRYIMPNQLVDGFSNQAPLFLIGTFMSLSVAGHYGLAIMMLSAPAALMGQAVAQAFLQYLGRHRGEHRSLRQAMYRIWLWMAVIGVAPFGIVLAFGPAIFELAFGDDWRAAGVVAQPLAILLYARFVSAPTSSIYLKLEMQREQLYFVVAAAAYRIGCYSLSAVGVELGTIVLIHAAIETVAIIAYNLVALHRLGGQPLPPGVRTT